MRTFSAIFRLLLSMNAVAQTNLTPAHMVTLNGDTIHGQAEKRTEVRNCKQCVFVAEGKREAVKYLPGEIACYRYEDDGRLYVSKKVEQFGRTERVFAIQENINSGQYLLGVINNWGNTNVTHAVLIIGYDRNKHSEYRCIDPWNDSSQNSRYIYYNASKFREVYRFK